MKGFEWSVKGGGETYVFVFKVELQKEVAALVFIPTKILEGGLQRAQTAFEPFSPSARTLKTRANIARPVVASNWVYIQVIYTQRIHAFFPTTILQQKFDIDPPGTRQASQVCADCYDAGAQLVSGVYVLFD